MKYHNNSTMLYRLLLSFLLLSSVVAVIATGSAKSNDESSTTTDSRLLQAGSYGDSTSSSGSSGLSTDYTGAAIAGVAILSAADSSGFFKTAGGKFVLAIIVIGACIFAFIYYRKKK
jgi:hypothetical protein